MIRLREGYAPTPDWFVRDLQASVGIYLGDRRPVLVVASESDAQRLAQAARARDTAVQAL